VLVSVVYVEYMLSVGKHDTVCLYFVLSRCHRWLLPWLTGLSELSLPLLWPMLQVWLTNT